MPKLPPLGSDDTFDEPLPVKRFRDTEDEAVRPDRPVRRRPRSRQTTATADMTSLFVLGAIVLWLGVVGAFGLGLYQAQNGYLPGETLLALLGAGLGPAIVLGAIALAVNALGDNRRRTDRLLLLLEDLVGPASGLPRSGTLAGRLKTEIEGLGDAAGATVERLKIIEAEIARQASAVGDLSAHAEDRLASACTRMTQERDAVQRLYLDIRAGAERISASFVDQAGGIRQASQAALTEFQTLEEAVTRHSESVRKFARDATREGAEAARTIEQALGRLEAVASSALTKAEMISSRYDQQRTSIDELTTGISENASRLEGRLVDHKALFEQLTTEIGDRLPSLVNGMESALASFEDRFDGMESRLRDAVASLKMEAEGLEESGEAAAGNMLRAAETAQAFGEEARDTFHRILGEVRKSLAGLAVLEKVEQDRPASRPPVRPREALAPPSPSRTSADDGEIQPIFGTRRAPTEDRPAEDGSEGASLNQVRKIGKPFTAAKGEARPAAPTIDPLADMSGWAQTEATPVLPLAADTRSPERSDERFDDLDLPTMDTTTGPSASSGPSTRSRVETPQRQATRPASPRPAQSSAPSQTTSSTKAQSASESGKLSKRRSDRSIKDILRAADQPLEEDGDPLILGLTASMKVEPAASEELRERAEGLADAIETAGFDPRRLLSREAARLELTALPAAIRAGQAHALLSAIGREALGPIRKLYWSDAVFRARADRFITDYETSLEAANRAAKPERPTVGSDEAAQIYLLLGEASERYH